MLLDHARLPALPRSQVVLNNVSISWSAEVPARAASPEVGISSS
ncbi:hypothetical protein WMF20_18940 [Sorangium sp. So ce834]